MALAIYRRYRPMTFADVLGQNHITELLQNASTQDRVAHAYLFYGPRGAGKTTTARLLAKVINCETRTKDKKFFIKGEPCNKCRPCNEINAGKSLDVIEIDAASNRGIDEIRNLREGIALSPTANTFKVFIIDEVHQLTKDAFNALLKTLEEPPKHAVLILATTEYDKLPATIISRTQKFHFRRIVLKELIGKLKKIVAAEKMSVTDEALELIASIAEGSMRDAESLLDQLVSFSGEVDLSAVEKVLGRVGFRQVSELAESVLTNNLEESLHHLERIYEDGYNVIDLCKELIHYVRRTVSIHLDPSLEEIFQDQFTESELQKLKEHAVHIQKEKHLKLLRLLIDAYGNMRYSPFPHIPFQVAIMESLQ